LTAALSLSITAAGVPAGATRRVQLADRWALWQGFASRGAWYNQSAQAKLHFDWLALPSPGKPPAASIYGGPADAFSRVRGAGK
jgi:hypothetical protein